MSKIILVIIVIVVIIIGAGGYWAYQSMVTSQGPIEKEQACIDSGGIVATSLCCQSAGDFPNLCLIGPCGCSPDNSHEIKICDCGEGKCFDGEKCIEEKANIIKVDNPKPNQVISSPLVVTGQARGFWFFEADFPIKLFDENGLLLAAGIAQALGDWMTEDFVEFSATLSFAAPSTLKGKLVLEKDNPSGLPEYSDELIIPVYFKAQP